MADVFSIDRSIPMEKWNEEQLLGYIESLTPAALEMVDGMDCTAPARIDHAREEVQQAVRVLQIRGYPFGYAARQRLSFVSWLPTQIDMRLMIRALIQKDHVDDGMRPGQYRMEITAEGDGEYAVRQYRAIGAIILGQVLLQGDPKEARRVVDAQVPTAIRLGRFDVAVTESHSLWVDLAAHLKRYPNSTFNLRCTEPGCHAVKVNIGDLIGGLVIATRTAKFLNDQVNGGSANEPTLKSHGTHTS